MWPERITWIRRASIAIFVAAPRRKSLRVTPKRVFLLCAGSPLRLKNGRWPRKPDKVVRRSRLGMMESQKRTQIRWVFQDEHRALAVTDSFQGFGRIAQ